MNAATSLLDPNTPSGNNQAPQRDPISRASQVNAPVGSEAATVETSTRSAPRNRGDSRGGRGRARKRAPRDDPPDAQTAATSDVSPRERQDASSGDAGQRAAAQRPRHARPPRRGVKSNANIAETGPPSAQSTSTLHRHPPRRTANLDPRRDDLTSTLIRSLSTPPYSDCPICFNAISPAQATWACSPTLPSPDDVNINANTQCCWTVFHLKCIRSWAEKSVKEVADAWRARGEQRSGEWRCPGCQSKREQLPNGYWCFCGSTHEPKPPRLVTPHSCGNACSRPSRCGHPCPLSCHPGPCPPCQIAMQLRCHCGARTLTFKCFHLAKGDAILACENICGKKLACGNHTCDRTCHEGVCTLCEVREEARCYCGKATRELRCGEGLEKSCAIRAKEPWIGRFECEAECQRPFDCGVHFCSKACHPPSFSPPPCPRSPSRITHCPCGKHVLGDPSSAAFFASDTQVVRTRCTDPIPNCSSTCLKPLQDCTHVCSSKCHTGPCPPCPIMVVRPCRCGAIRRDVRCSSVQAHAGQHDEVLCDKPCTALRACGRHHCNRVCCPLASLALPKGKGKKKGLAVENAPVDDTGLHECDLLCGRLLGCGNHRCEEQDHRGACPPCLRSSFDEMVCHCGRTILEPPIPCGTRMNCTYQCTRDPPPCGHPSSQHTCHEDPTPCPPCPFLTGKPCACGKKVISNVKCFQEKVNCGLPCGKLLACGFHHCEQLCHASSCGPCTAVCGKSRKLCLPNHHPCTQPCHAPSACSESELCQTLITLTCPCGRIKQTVLCGRSTSNVPSNEALSSQRIKCLSECQIAKRNARLADALGINPEMRERVREVVYNDGLVAFAKANAKLLASVEKTFAEFVASEKRTQVLPHVPMDRRKFVQELASIYRMDTQLVDQEPHRSVQLIRRIDTRIPAPLLSNIIPPSAPVNLGKLADMRPPPPVRHRSPAPPTPTATPPPVRPSGGVGSWSAIVARPVGAPSTITQQQQIRSGAYAARPSSDGGIAERKAVQSVANIPLVTASRSTFVESSGIPTIAHGVDSGVPSDWEDDS